MNCNGTEIQAQTSCPRRPARFGLAIRLLIGLWFFSSVPASIVFGQTWKDLAGLPTGNRFRSAAATGPDWKVYVAGGVAQLQPLGSVAAFDPRTCSWNEVQPMGTPRSDLALVTAPDGFIYAIGGNSGNVASAVVERYDAAKNQWTPMPSMNQPRGGLAAAVGPDGLIYAIGGFDGTTMLKTVEKFDSKAGTWVSAPPMQKVRQGHAAVTALDGSIYVFGGDSPATGERFSANAWSPPFPLNNNFNGFSSTLGPDGLIYNIGGGNANCGFDLVEAFDPLGTWIPLPSMAQRRGSLASATTDGRILAIGGYSKLCGGELSSVEALGPLFAPNFDPNRRAHYRFDLSDETPCCCFDRDSSPHSNHLTLSNNPMAIIGRVRSAVHLNGTSQSAMAVDSPSLNFGSGDFTIEGWIRPDRPPNQLGGDLVGRFLVILDKRVSQPFYRGYHLFVQPNGRLGLQIANGVIFANYLTDIPGAQPSHHSIKWNEWTHVAVSVSRGSTAAAGRLYINGALAGEFVPLEGDVTNTAPLHLGRHSLNPSLRFWGALDEITLYDRALTWPELRAVFLAGRVGKQ